MPLLADLVVTFLVLALVGFLLHLIVDYIPMADPVKQVLTVLLIVLIVLYILAVLTGGASLIHLPLHAR